MVWGEFGEDLKGSGRILEGLGVVLGGCEGFGGGFGGILWELGEI